LPVIDTHAHWTPERYRAAIAADGAWYGLDETVGELEHFGFRMNLDERIADMDALGVDIEVISPTAGFFQYDNDPATAARIARECNDEIAEVVSRAPERFVGLSTLPMQDIDAAVAELRRSMEELGLKGAMVADHVNRVLYDEERFVPFWTEAERLGAVIFFHQGQGQQRFYGGVGRLHLDNSIGNLADRALTFGTLVSGGVLDRFPGLNLLLAHAGGYTVFATARMDKAAGAFPLDRDDSGYIAPYPSKPPEYHSPASHPPSAYLRRFYYDSCTFTPETLRFLVDAVGADRVALGTDAPATMVLTDGVRWIESLDCLTDAEKQAILVDTPAQLFGL
jgi:aminocarboxymuconate-semialdehyde decarboxylase